MSINAAAQNRTPRRLYRSCTPRRFTYSHCIGAGERPHTKEDVNPVTIREQITAAHRMVADYERIASESAERAQADADALADAKRELQALELRLQAPRRTFVQHP